MDHSDIGRQIEQTEADIAQGDQRLRDLRGQLWPSTKALVTRYRRPALIGLGVLALVALFAYPRRGKIMVAVRQASSHPLGRMLMSRLPWMGVLLPILRGERGAARRSLLSVVAPWLWKRVSHGPEQTRPTAPKGR